MKLFHRIVLIYAVLIAANLGAWVGAFIAFRNFPLGLGTALLAYGFGLRHAVDADHIAAIDNVTRKLMQEQKRPAAVGLFFSLGHSTIVVLATIAVAATALAVQAKFSFLQSVGGIVGTSVSAGFLLAIAIMNIFVLTGLVKNFRAVRGGQLVTESVSGHGILTKIFRPLFGIIRHSWQMYPLGVLFGLGFDTATEIGLLGISAAEAAKGMSVWSILVFPALFTAGMSLVDTTDGILMLGAYGWAFIKPIRKLYYNITITFVSVVVALLVGGIEALGLIGGQLGLSGAFWSALDALNNHFGVIGFLIIGVFALSWIFAAVVYRLKGYHRVEMG
jgi:high-affinity nickel-transport protein